jgi:hypothetical protein
MVCVIPSEEETFNLPPDLLVYTLLLLSRFKTFLDNEAFHRIANAPGELCVRLASTETDQIVLVFLYPRCYKHKS